MNPILPSVRHMRALVALARTGSFTLAADHLNLTQSALSGQIKELEQRLGVRVVERTTRKAQLSELGRELTPLFDKMLQDLEGAMTDLASRKALKQGVVRVAAPQMLSCTLLPEAMAAYGARYPDIQLRLADTPVEQVLARVLSGEADFGIGPERDAMAGISAQPLFEMPFVVVFPEGHALQQRARIRWADIGEFALIALQGQFTERLLQDMHSSLRELSLRPANEVTFMTTALAMVHARLGITVCLPYAEKMVQLYGLHMRPLQEPQLTRRFFIYTRSTRTLSPAAASFADFLQQSMAAHAWQVSRP
ncbi:MAG: LysR family transcriptional regulator [Duganella sp.]